MPVFIQLIVVVVVLGLLYWLVQQLPLPEPFPTIIKILMVLGLILWLLSAVGMLPGWSGGHSIDLR